MFAFGRLRADVGDREGFVREGDPGAQKKQLAAVRDQINEKEIHREEGPGQAHHDGARHPHLHLTSLPHQNTRLLPGRKETLPCTRVLSGGRTLRTPLQEEKTSRKRVTISLSRARFFAAQVLLALEYLHSKNIIYRE